MRSNIIFEHPDWSPLKEMPAGCEGAWANNHGLIVGLQHFGPDESLRNRLADVKAVRDHYRAGFAAEGMGLIECDVFGLGKVRAVRAIGKLLLQPPGAAYAGTIALPLPQESYVFNLMDQETGLSGMRDTSVWMKTSMELQEQGYVLDLPEGQPGREPDTAKAPMAWKHSQTGTVRRWAEDPYEPGYEGPCLRNMADAPEHDRAFPQHPLSQVRVVLQCLAQNVTLSADLQKRAAGKSRWRWW